MDLSQLRGQLARVTELVERWQASHKIDALERDLALEKLRQLYDAILDGAPSPMQPLPEEVRPSEEEVPFEEEPADEEVLPVSLDLEDIFTMPELPAEEEAFTAPEPEPESVEESEPEPVAEPEPELVTEPEPEPTPEPEPEPEPVVAPAPEQSAYVASSLFGPEEEQLVRHRHKQRVIMSLYDNEPTAGAASLFGENPAPKSAPAPSVEPAPVAPKPVVETSAPQAEPTPAVEPSTPAPAPAQTVLGEVINPHMQTLADTLPPAVDRASELRRQEKVTDLRKAIGINDKFLLIRDLFGGDGATYEITIRTLNNFEDFDECMIYIAENFAWNPNSDGAKLLMDLLERKFA